MGPHRKPGDNLRHWLHSVSNPGNPNVLWNAIAGIRTEAEWDDHGEEYAHSWDGPDVWSVVQVPEGEWLLSLYFFNPNGHENRNGYRDFLLELRKGNDIRMSGKHPEIGGDELSQPVLDRSRVYDFAGCGCWKNFGISSPGTFYIRVARNGSFNTILNAVCISDRNDPYESILSLRMDRAVPRRFSHQVRTGGMNAGLVPGLALRAWAAAFKPWGTAAPLSRRAMLEAYRYAADKKANADILERWRYMLALWTPTDDNAMDAELAAAWDAVQDQYPHKRSSFWYPHSPGVVPLTPQELEYADSFGLSWRQFAPGFKGKRTMTIEQLKDKIRASSQTNNQ